MKKLVILLCMIGMMLGVAGCEEEKTLVGYDVDLARAVGELLGVDVEFVEIDWSTKEAELESKQIDLIWNELTITDERLEAMDISVPYLKNAQVMVIRQSDVDTYTSVESIVDAKLTAESGSAGASYLDDLDILVDSEKNYVDNMLTVLTELVSGTSDVGVMDSVMANYYMTSDSSYADQLMVLNDVTLVEEEIGIALRKDSPAFLDKINTALSTLYADGTMMDIATVYGLEAEVIACEYTSIFDTLEDTSDWDYILDKGCITIGVTYFQPIAYYE